MAIPDRMKGDVFWDKPVSMEELIAVNTVLQSSVKRALELTPWEILEAGLGFIGTDGTLILAPGVSEGPRRQVLEDNSATINSTTTAMKNRDLSSRFLAWTADGSEEVGAAPWTPIVPVTITASGGGEPPATVIVAAVAAKLDLALWFTVSSAAAGTWALDFREDPVGTPAVVVPDYTNVPINLSAKDDYPHTSWGIRIENITVNKAIGIADGAGGDWPNNGILTFSGFARTVA